MQTLNDIDIAIQVTRLHAKEINVRITQKVLTLLHGVPVPPAFLTNPEKELFGAQSLEHTLAELVLRYRFAFASVLSIKNAAQHK